MKPAVGNMNCSTCKENCCGSEPFFLPVLLPEELDLYSLKDEHKSPLGSSLWTLKREEDHCIYFDTFTNRCLIYSKRPIECRLYPFLFDFSTNNIEIKLDKKFCIKGPVALIPQLNLNIPKDWIKAYQLMSPKLKKSYHGYSSL